MAGKVAAFATGADRALELPLQTGVMSPAEEGPLTQRHSDSARTRTRAGSEFPCGSVPMNDEPKRGCAGGSDDDCCDGAECGFRAGAGCGELRRRLLGSGFGG